MSLTPILAYTLLPLLSITGGLVMMFASQAPVAMRPGVVGLGGFMLIIAFGGLSLVMAMQAVRAQAKANRSGT
jgi:hypothetical protein